MSDNWIREEIRLAAEQWRQMPDEYKPRVNADYWSNPDE